MADDEGLIKKQVIAQIDGRTTVICLHASGQIRPVHLPFETLNGPYMHPPFHVHCRSLVAPWLPGFVNNLRKAANDELRRRPARIRKMADGRVPNRIPPPADSVALAPQAKKPAARRKPAAKKATATRKKAPPKALPPKRTEAIKEGDRPDSPIKDRDEAAQYLAARGPLEDIHDTVLREAMLRVPDRFRIEKLGGGVTDSYWVTDKVSGERWVMKKGDYAQEYESREHQREDLNEWVSAHLARRWGLNAPEVRFAGDEWILMRDIVTTIPGSKQSGGGAMGSSPSMHLDTMLASVFDFLTGNGDRHGGNWIPLLAPNGDLRLGLIDHGLTFDGRARRTVGDVDALLALSFDRYQHIGANGGFWESLLHAKYIGDDIIASSAEATEEWVAGVIADIQDGGFWDDMVAEIEDKVGGSDHLDFMLRMLQARMETLLASPPDWLAWGVGDDAVQASGD